jgi:hypothetical protein
VGFISSPYRKPLGRFINRYPQDAIDFFLTKERMNARPLMALFQCVLKDRETWTLRRALTSDAGVAKLTGLLRGPYADVGSDITNELQYQTLRIIRTLSRFAPAWLSRNRALVEAMTALWRSQQRRVRWVDGVHALHAHKHCASPLFRLVTFALCTWLQVVHRRCQRDAELPRDQGDDEDAGAVLPHGIPSGRCSSVSSGAAAAVRPAAGILHLPSVDGVGR